jgi:hypothetical protein
MRPPLLIARNYEPKSGHVCRPLCRRTRFGAAISTGFPRHSVRCCWNREKAMTQGTRDLPSFCVATTLRTECPLWVNNGHGGQLKQCLLYPRKRTSEPACIISKSSSGSLAICTAILRDSSFVSSLAADRRPGLMPEIDERERLTAAIADTNQASYVSLVASVHRSFLQAPNSRAHTIDEESAGSMCDTPQARHSKV